jgi:ATP-dependent DNA helicase PIF1
VAVGTRLVVTVNCFNSSCLNGEVGVVRDFELDTAGQVKSIILQRIDGAAPPVRVDRETVYFNFAHDPGHVLMRNGFPVNLAWAMTVHKMQGATMDFLCLSSSSFFVHGHLYVALSRVRLSTNLELTRKLQPRMVQANKFATQVYARMTPLLLDEKLIKL